jgi:hypothetical protein
MNPTRRRFLKTGLAGAAALAIAGGIAWIRRVGTAAALPALDDDARSVVRAIVPSMLAGALPAADPDRALAVDETVLAVDRAVAGLPPASRGELAQLFSLLSLGVGRRVFAGVASAWNDATRDEIDAFLASWQTSRWSLKRTAYDALHQLVIAAWYANPRAWPSIGYPGPPAFGLHT